MTYLLDTNVCIRLLNNTSPTVTARLAAQQPENIVTRMRSLSEVAALDYGEVADGDGGDGGVVGIVRR